uniref:UDP-N-acetyl-alpha-D-galactosamine: polypeptide N-acetylgalactosaminyltransferase 7 n=1 Tax=Oncorhynchus tshawytscha TaxID=74940 RepID=A0AAZ3Q1N0_ONCTS
MKCYRNLVKRCFFPASEHSLIYINIPCYPLHVQYVCLQPFEFFLSSYCRCKYWHYDDNLLTSSVIIVFHNEGWSTLMRTVHSVIKRTPRRYLAEIVMIDDFSNKVHLKERLEEYIKQWNGLVKLHRNEKREGLIQARSIGAHVATLGQVLIYLDAHCEVAANWYAPLVAPISKDRTVCTVPLIDYIDGSDYTIEPQQGGDEDGLAREPGTGACCGRECLSPAGRRQSESIRPSLIGLLPWLGVCLPLRGTSSLSWASMTQDCRSGEGRTLRYPIRSGSVVASCSLCRAPAWAISTAYRAGRATHPLPMLAPRPHLRTMCVWWRFGGTTTRTTSMQAGRRPSPWPTGTSASSRSSERSTAARASSGSWKKLPMTSP